MPVKCEEYNKVCVVTIDGDFAGAEIEAARKAIEERIDERQIVEFVLDCEKTTFIDSEGLEMILWLKRRCDELFGQIKLAGVDADMRKILEMTRLLHHFECHGDLPSALKTMG